MPLRLVNRQTHGLYNLCYMHDPIEVLISKAETGIQFPPAWYITNAATSREGTEAAIMSLFR